MRKGCVSCRLVGTAPPPAFKREIEKKERARGQEEKMWDEKMWRWEDVRRCEKMWEDVKMRRCEDEKMWRWEDVKMRRCEKMWEDVKMRRWGEDEDEKMWRCEDEKMWRWEGVLQTPTIGRTLRPDALGKKDLISRAKVRRHAWPWQVWPGGAGGSVQNNGGFNRV